MKIINNDAKDRKWCFDDKKLIMFKIGNYDLNIRIDNVEYKKWWCWR